jgi:hypothetical protein
MTAPKSGDRIIMKLNDGGYDFFTVSHSGERVPSGGEDFSDDLRQAYEIARNGLDDKSQVWLCEQDTPNELEAISDLNWPSFFNQQPETRELCFTLRRDGHHYQCDLINRGERSWSVELFKNGKYDHGLGPSFDTREEAIEAAESERDAINRGELDGW